VKVETKSFPVRPDLGQLEEDVRDLLRTIQRRATLLAWGERFHDQAWVSRPAMRLIEERGGRA
jgi:hypothetical protein